ncbi:MAG: 2-oxoacid:acceptor oxidoreductase subunit alpha [Candidatus Aenigmatarchaeota archaeon]|nr:2-oxoacid:acceptor oxidoreductase subunit alpha [Candidatus Aenigmarchaeota archaeon]
MTEFSWKIGGEAGYGIMTSGLIFGKAFVKGGLFAFDTNEYPSLIRGGHNTYTVRVSDEPIFSHSKKIDILVALTKLAVDKHKDEITENGFIIFDQSVFSINDDEIRDDIKLLPLPLTEIATKIGGQAIMRNNVAIGASFGLIDYNFENLVDVIKGIFGGKKGEEVAKTNIDVAREGYNYVLKNFGNLAKSIKMTVKKPIKRMYITGNEAISLGAIKAGCKFYSAYPMTPASSILHFLSSKENDYNIVVKQTEDEIAAIHMAIGASFAGVRSMTGTSGGGFSLMTEALGLAALTETPLVVVLAQRPGPSTGMPTHTEQGDLKFVINASNGEFPRVVVAPGDVNECFYETFNAFNIAEKYQIPVIILTDKFLAEAHSTNDFFVTKHLKIDRGLLLTDEKAKEIKDYKRYENTATGISHRSIPSQTAIFKAATDEHDEYGRLSEEQSDRIIQMDKRFRKLKVIESEIDGVKIYGDEDADINIISWGSTKGPILEAMKIFAEKGIKVRFIQVLYLMPFPTSKIKILLENNKNKIIVENNKTAQLASLIKEHTGIDVDYKILKYDGRPFSPEDIYEKIDEVLTFAKL